jgi:hypothetical protein
MHSLSLQQILFFISYTFIWNLTLKYGSHWTFILGSEVNGVSILLMFYYMHENTLEKLEGAGGWNSILLYMPKNIVETFCH